MFLDDFQNAELRIYIKVRAMVIIKIIIIEVAATRTRNVGKVRKLKGLV